MRIEELLKEKREAIPGLAAMQAGLHPDLVEQVGRPGGALWSTPHSHDEQRTPDRISAVENEPTGTEMQVR